MRLGTEHRLMVGMDWDLSGLLLGSATNTLFGRVVCILDLWAVASHDRSDSSVCWETDLSRRIPLRFDQVGYRRAAFDLLSALLFAPVDDCLTHGRMKNLVDRPH